MAELQIGLFDHQPTPSELANLKARDLEFEQCPKDHAVQFVRAHHSRLPSTQSGPWKYAFRAHFRGYTVAVALWNNPSARTLPANWLELRRMACSPDAPRNTASRFLGWMARFLRTNEPQADRLISYQDTAVHEGTIYKAAGWKPGFVSKARQRDRSKPRAGTKRAYRSNMNGAEPDASMKIRWELKL